VLYLPFSLCIEFPYPFFMAFKSPVANPPEAGGIILLSLVEKLNKLVMLVTVDPFPFLDVVQTGKIV
jgi:hypothetical protein